jgi:hypothetical protein
MTRDAASVDARGPRMIADPRLAAEFRVAVPTVHRRFTEWTQVALWRRPHRAVLDE